MTSAKKPTSRSLPPEFPAGYDLLHDPVRNKGTAFTERERNELGLRGLLPPRVDTMREQVTRSLENYTPNQMTSRNTST